jgi:hypothetical protein
MRYHNAATLTALATIFKLPALEVQIADTCALTDPKFHSDLEPLFRKKGAADTPGTDRRNALSRDDCETEGGWGETTQIEKEKAGELRSFLDGKKRLITPSSFYEHLITRIVLSHPAGAPAPKGTDTSTKFRPRGRFRPKSRRNPAGPWVSGPRRPRVIKTRGPPNSEEG